MTTTGMLSQTHVKIICNIKGCHARDFASSPGDAVRIDDLFSQFSCLTWNVDGLLSKLDNHEFIAYIRSFDFVCLVETFVDTFDSALFPDHKLFCSPAVKLSKKGRRSGGLVVLVRKELVVFCQQLECKYDHVLLFSMNKECFGLSKDVLFVCVYIPPIGSPYYALSGIDNGISVLEDCIADIQLSFDVHTILCGDFNARTGCVPYEVIIPSQSFDVHSDNNPDYFTRNSQDTNENVFGKMLLNLCSTFGLCILNGACKGDLHGCYTYVTDSGSSIIDHFFVSEERFSILSPTMELSVAEMTESKHIPVEFRFCVS